MVVLRRRGEHFEKLIFDRSLSEAYKLKLISTSLIGAPQQAEDLTWSTTPQELQRSAADLKGFASCADPMVYLGRVLGSFFWIISFRPEVPEHDFEGQKLWIMSP